MKRKDFLYRLSLGTPPLLLGSPLLIHCGCKKESIAQQNPRNTKISKQLMMNLKLCFPFQKKLMGEISMLNTPHQKSNPGHLQKFWDIKKTDAWALPYLLKSEQFWTLNFQIG